ncbi:MAG: DNA-directed DNA polymerase II small subunit [Archaeoglobales archaeon]|nr:DNA-directed DNA polymerase II small subunit [Archaeoglobales archaeon]
MMVKNVASIIVKKFLVRGYNVNPKAVEMLQMVENLDEVVDEICRNAAGRFIITENDVEAALKSLNNKKIVIPNLEKKKEIEEIKILKDVTGNSLTEGKLEDFQLYFNSRYEKISRILRSRVSSVPIASLGRFKGENVTVVGMVNSIKETPRGYYIELEDPTGFINCIASGKLAEIAQTLLGDEVIAVSGTLKDRNIIADRIIFPDVPVNGNRKIVKDFFIVFISDTHFGSKEFLEDDWNKFVSWLNCETKGSEIAEMVKYVIVAGDIVDGVGIYPGQENDLKIVNIYEQYEVAAKHFDEIRKDIKIIMSPGNHDAVRQAEPQPALPKEIRKLFSNNVVHVGNPCYISLDGVKVLIYHGRSLDDVVSKIPKLNYESPHFAMEELLKRRHLSPMYGGRSPIAPEKEDYLVIEDIPDVIHCGHVHTYGAGFYRGVLLVNSSTWQNQTEFQRKMNLNPMPCNVAVYKPGGDLYRIKFYGGSNEICGS